ncbi:hypothetical protein GS399_05440 [Pedobacter sp. HMF7647]|uniref:Uncharacterized protein n=1 Tax=Hufsiella arboris TaxID=2695275 RepID=A0A7K1Y8K5_9SPHI|nr:hypothetical protein [Hufsiella arboris]MXV50409.1 hypothetical protein [Hufsiella arboris]
MNAKLLKKIEELTLYLIEMEKDLARQQSLIEGQACEIKKLKKKMKVIYPRNYSWGDSF